MRQNAVLCGNGLTAIYKGHIMAVGDTHVFTGFLTPVLTQIPFQSHQLIFSHASAEVRDKNTPEQNFALTSLKHTTTRS